MRIACGGHSDRVAGLLGLLEETGHAPSMTWTTDRRIPGLRFAKDEAMMSGILADIAFASPRIVDRCSGDGYALSWDPWVSDDAKPVRSFLGYRGVATVLHCLRDAKA